MNARGCSGPRVVDSCWLTKPKPMGNLMPTILREGGWRFVIHTDDHAPPHVHVIRPGGGEVKVSLPGAGEYVTVLRVKDLPTHEAMRAVRLVEEHRERLLLAWGEIHG